VSNPFCLFKWQIKYVEANLDRTMKTHSVWIIRWSI